MDAGQPGLTMQTRPGRVKSVLLESVLVGIVGAILAFAANALSPAGLKLTRNYSPGGAVAAAQAVSRGLGVSAADANKILQQQLAAEGLQLADSNRVAQLFNEGAKGQGQIVFIDARDDEHYQTGHIPGAYQLDHLHPERYLATVLPACQVAQQILVYCKGGSCEDSEQTAILLRDAGIPRDRLFVYAGGFDEWMANRLAVEIRDRNSGRIERAAAGVSADAPK